MDVEEYAQLTEGYSGADIQALVYNAHLDAVHSSISELDATAAANGNGGKSAEVKEDEAAARFVTFGGPKDVAVLSRADQAARTKRVWNVPH